MKKAFLVTIGIIIYTLTNAEVTKGYYVTFEYDTIYVDFVAPYGCNPIPKHFTWSAIYHDNKNNKVLLSPKVAKEIVWSLDSGDSYRMVSILNTARYPSPMDKSGLRLFAEPIIENEALNLYLFHTYNGPLYLPSNGEVSRAIFVKEDGSMLDTGYFGDRKRIRKFLSDCPVVVSTLKNRKHKIKNYNEVVDLYNSSCGNDNTSIIKN